MTEYTETVIHPLKGQRVLVTGATGFTGSVLVRKLNKIGAHITAIARSSSNIKPFNDLNIRWVRGEVFDERVIDDAIDKVSFVFHVAAAFREAKISDDTYYNVHVKSTQRLAKKALTLDQFKRFIHISTVGVHSHIASPPADETYPIKPGDIYQKTKAEAELWIREFAKNEDLPLTVVRPAAIYGPGDKRLLKIFRMSRKKIFPIIGYGKCLYHLIHVDDLTEFFMAVASHPKALGEVFICGNTEHIPLTDFVHLASEIYGVKVRFIRVPAWPLFLIGYGFELVFRPLGIEPPIYRRRVAFFTKDRSFDTRKMQTLVAFTPKYDNKKGIQETAKWYLENSWL